MDAEGIQEARLKRSWELDRRLFDYLTRNSIPQGVWELCQAAMELGEANYFYPESEEPFSTRSAMRRLEKAALDAYGAGGLQMHTMLALEAIAGVYASEYEYWANRETSGEQFELLERHRIELLAVAREFWASFSRTMPAADERGRDPERAARNPLGSIWGE